MSQTAVLQDEREKRKKGTASEPVRAVSTQKPNGPLVKRAAKPRNPAVRAGRMAFGSIAHHLANAGWNTLQVFNRLVPEKRVQPKWAPAPLLKSYERSKPPLGFPRETDSLCPKCVLEIRSAIMEGREDWQVLIQGKPGEIKARIVERDGQI
ncbi:MAG TPA: hypothetical protein VGR38_12460, partial [Candidatus Polarisedimenticolia bacterium]|nr:hypothetical protein [Candidatus Polarisedimenticolia bacterium]